MVLKNKYYSIKKDIAASSLRKNLALIELYKEYIDYLKTDVVDRIDNKVNLKREKEYRVYQNSYYDLGVEKEIFETVFNYKYAELKKRERLKFRAYREEIRRKIAKLDPAVSTQLIEDQISSVDRFEKEIEEKIKKTTDEWKKEFELESQRRISLNPSEEKLKELKETAEKNISAYASEISEKLNARNNAKIERIKRKIAKFEAKTENKRAKLLEANNKFTEIETESNNKFKAKKIEKLTKEIASHEALLAKAENDQEKQKQTKILNSLRTDLSLLENSNKDVYKLLKDDEILAIDNLCMYFGGIKAVNNLSFSVKHKEIFGLIGPNGAGKTTVFNCITQFYKPTAGNISFRNKNNEIVDLTKEVVHNVILQGIVRTFQNLEVVKDITVLDNLLIAAHRDYTSGLFRHMLHTPILRVEENVIRQRAIKVLEFMGILKYKDMYAWGLPYGILKKIEIARTLMCNPQLIILDEPAAGLNDSETVELAALIRRIRDEYDTTILLVEHDMGLVMDVCDRICAISFGNLLGLGTPKEIQNNKVVQEAYLGVSED